ncbi:MAG: prenyltransferase [Bacteroidales bacterium]|nr:prenyltransferase [Bacteroidales bacterium]
MSKAKDWFFATRPWSLVVSAAPVLLTATFLIWKMGPSNFNWVNAILALIGIQLFHMAGNVISDNKDFTNGIDNKEAFCVPFLVNGMFDLKKHLRFGYLLFAAGCIVGLILLCRSGWTLALIAVPGLILTITYPKSKFVALGDLTIFINFGFLPILGTSFVSVGYIEWSALLLAIPIGFVTVAVLHANNTRDIESDAKADATSFAALIGRNISARLYQTYMWIPIVYVTIMVILQLFPIWTLLTLVSIPISLQNTKQAQKFYSEGLSAFNNLDQMTAKLQLSFSLSLMIGFIISIII